MSIEPWPPFFQQWKTWLPSATEPVQVTRFDGTIAPLSSAASATTGLNVDPGGYIPVIALFKSGFSGSSLSWRHISGVTVVVEGFGSKPGADTLAMTSPLSTSIT